MESQEERNLEVADGLVQIYRMSAKKFGANL